MFLFILVYNYSSLYNLLPASPGFASITSSGDFSPGSQFRLTCTVSGVSPAPNIFWSGPQGQIGSSTADLQLGEIMSAGDSHSRTLVFRSLSPDQAGTYVCSNTATSPATVQQDVFLGSECYCQYPQFCNFVSKPPVSTLMAAL